MLTIISAILDGKCPFSSGKLVVDALKKIHPTPAMKVGSVLSQPSVRQLVTMPLSAQGTVYRQYIFYLTSHL